MRKFIAGLVAVIALALPGIASANTGSVTAATCTAITFHYDNNFPAGTTNATETYTVDGVTKTRVYGVVGGATHDDVVTFTSPGKATFTITTNSTWTLSGTQHSFGVQTFNPSGCAVVCVPTVTTVYVDRPTIVYVDRPYPVTTIQYVNHDVPGPTTVVYVTKEVPGPETIQYVEKQVPGGTVVQQVTKEVPGAVTVQYLTVQVPGATVVKTITRYRTRIVNHVKVKTKVIIKLVPKKYPYTK